MGKNADEVIDFNLYLDANDVWTTTPPRLCACADPENCREVPPFVRCKRLEQHAQFHSTPKE